MVIRQNEFISFKGRRDVSKDSSGSPSSEGCNRGLLKGDGEILGMNHSKRALLSR